MLPPVRIEPGTSDSKSNTKMLPKGRIEPGTSDSKSNTTLSELVWHVIFKLSSVHIPLQSLDDSFRINRA